MSKTYGELPLIEAWEVVSNECHGDYIEYVEDVAIWIKRSIPRAVIHEHLLKSYGVCPRCSERVSMRFHPRHCGKCAQALEWSEE
jgi:ribosomal protein S27AE